MASLIIVVLYAVIAIIYIFLAFFIVYHLANFSVKSGLTTLTLFIFIVLSSALFLTNISFFFSINWDSLLTRVLS